MNDPERLLASDTDEVRALLRAAAEEEPSAAATAQLHRLLGLAPPATVQLAAAKVSMLALVSKWVGVASIGLLASYGALQLAQPASPEVVAPRQQDTLGDELRRLEGARAALRSAPEQALRALDAYDGAYAHGTLREEALALRIDTLLALARRDEGQALARQFLRSYPSSVHAARVRAWLDAE